MGPAEVHGVGEGGGDLAEAAVGRLRVRDNPSIPFTGATVTLDPARSSLTLPLTGYTAALNTAEAPQSRIPATKLAQPEPETDPAELMRQMVEASR